MQRSERRRLGWKGQPLHACPVDSARSETILTSKTLISNKSFLLRARAVAEKGPALMSAYVDAWLTRLSAMCDRQEAFTILSAFLIPATGWR